jgi:hypothetical protein
MSLTDAVIEAGAIPGDDVSRDEKKAYSESLSRHLAVEVAEGLRRIGFPNVKPFRGGPGEKEFQGGLGPKKVDVSYADEQHGLMLAVSIKTICFAPFGKNLKNRFGDLCTEAITLHMRFPYSVIAGLFAFPLASSLDDASGRRELSTFRRATKLFGTISGRREYTDPGEKFENITMMLFEPAGGSVRLVDAHSEADLTEEKYFERLRETYNRRNPHASIDELDGSDNLLFY